MKNKKAFTLIELLIVVAIIGLLAAAVLVSMGQSRKNARINAVKTSLKASLPAIISCKDNNGSVSAPSGGTEICTTGVGLTGAKWPILNYGYAYIAGGNHNSSSCSFQVSTNGDSPNLTCDCVKQTCS